jgi:hypothetical protein
MGERQPRTYASLEGAEDEVEDADKCSTSTRGDQHPDATPSASSSSKSFPAAAARKASISEVATEASTPHCAPPSWLARIVEFPFRVKNPVTGVYLPEATAWLRGHGHLKAGHSRSRLYGQYRSLVSLAR